MDQHFAMPDSVVRYARSVIVQYRFIMKGFTCCWIPANPIAFAKLEKSGFHCGIVGSKCGCEISIVVKKIVRLLLSGDECGKEEAG